MGPGKPPWLKNAGPPGDLLLTRNMPMPVKPRNTSVVRSRFGSIACGASCAANEGAERSAMLTLGCTGAQTPLGEAQSARRDGAMELREAETWMSKSAFVFSCRVEHGPANPNL